MNEKLKYVYIEEVIKYLPSNQKEDIKKELNTIIDDQLDNENMSLEDILIELGNPKDLAYRYLDEHPYVIGPRLKESYYNVLRYVLPIVALAIVALQILTWIFSGGFNLIELLASVINAGFVAFTYITVGFIIAEKVIQDKDQDDEWHPDHLNLAKYEQKPYKRSNIITGLIFTAILIIIFNWYPHLIGINSVSDGQHISFIDFDVYRSTFLPWINIALIILLTRLFIRFFLNKEEKLAVILSVSMHFVASLILIIVFLNPNLLNPSLTLEFSNMNFPDFINFQFIYNLFRLIAGVIVIVFAVESYQDIKDVNKTV